MVHVILYSHEFETEYIFSVVVDFDVQMGDCRDVTGDGNNDGYGRPANVH